ncbi:hypothetical protein DFH09DRAFT_1097259 [Mycena vulgaris]|nr:hypothetical protein DFH09DRAFT_1097259 [Mycena vulgaris]
MAQASSGAQYPGRMVQAQAREALRELQRTPRTRVDAASILRCESDRRTEKERRKSPKSRRRKERTRGKRPPITRIHISIAYRSLGGGGPWLRPAELRTYEVLQHIPSLRSGVDSSVSFGRVFMLAGSTIESSKKGAQQDEAAQHHSSPFGDHPLLWGAYVPDLSEMPRDHGGGRLPTAPRITIAAMQDSARPRRQHSSAARMIGDYPTFAEGPVPNADDNTQSKDIPADPLLARRLEKRRRLEFGGHSQLQFSWIKSLAHSDPTCPDDLRLLMDHSAANDDLSLLIVPEGGKWRERRAVAGDDAGGLLMGRVKRVKILSPDRSDGGRITLKPEHSLKEPSGYFLVRPASQDRPPDQALMEHRSAKELEVQRKADPEDAGEDGVGMRSCDDLDDAEKPGIVDSCPRSADPEDFALHWGNEIHEARGRGVQRVQPTFEHLLSSQFMRRRTRLAAVTPRNPGVSWWRIAQQTVEDSRHMTAASTTGEDTLNQPKPEIVPESRNLSSDTRKTQCLDAVPAVFSRRDVRGTK